MLLQQQPTAL